MRWRPLAAALSPGFSLIAAAAISGCQLFESLDGLTGGDAAAKGSTVGVEAGDDRIDASDTDVRVPPGSDASNEEASDGAMPEGGPVAAVPLADVGSVQAPSGSAQQGPLVWVPGIQSWWLLYPDPATPGVLSAMASSDFQTWSRVSGSIPLPASVSDGRNVAAFAGAVAGNDVLHVSVSVAVSSGDRRHLHARAHPASGQLRFDATTVLGTSPAALSGLDPDGPATTLASDGTIVDTSGWYEAADSGATGNEYAWTTTSPDPGGAWIPPWGGVASVSIVPQFVNARTLLALGGSNLMALWEGGDAEPDPSNVDFAVGSGAQWSAKASVFAASTQDPNDWGACRLAAAVHAVRHTVAGAWEHRVWNATSFADGSNMPALGSPTGTGVVVLCDGTRVRVFAMTSGAGNPVSETWWDGTAWAPWIPVVSAGTAARSYLSGAITPGGRVALVWTEPADAGALVAGALVDDGL